MIEAGIRQLVHMSHATIRTVTGVCGTNILGYTYDGMGSRGGFSLNKVKK